MTSTRILSKLERVPLREAWKHEAGEFTPWLADAENLDAMAAAVGISELELVATEHGVGDFKHTSINRPITKISHHPVIVELKGTLGHLK